MVSVPPKIKIIMVGEVCVGKSCLVKQFIDTDNFNLQNVSATINPDFKICDVQVDGKVLRLEIVDTAGQERFRSLIPSYFRRADGVILVYDVNCLKSFKNIENWLNDVDQYNSNDHLVKMLIGNKIDEPDENRQVHRNIGINFARKHNMLFCETSAKWKNTVKTAFEEMAEQITKSEHFVWEITEENTLQLGQVEQKEKRWYQYCWPW